MSNTGDVSSKRKSRVGFISTSVFSVLSVCVSGVTVVCVLQK